MNSRIILLPLAALSAFAQDVPLAADGVRALWSTEFRQSRVESPSPRTPNKPAALGITLWRLRSASSARQTRMIIHEAETNSPKEFTAERISLSTQLLPEDRIRLSIESAQPGFLYVATQELYPGGKLGQPHLLFPSRRIREGENRVVPRRPIDIPEITNKRPYFTIKKEGAQQAEILTIWVTPAPLPRLMVESQPIPIEDAEWQNLKQTWGINVTRIETGAPSSWSAAEKAASEGTRALKPSDPLPQHIYRAPSSQGLLLSLPLQMAQ